jgi:hypothetical protein
MGFSRTMRNTATWANGMAYLVTVDIFSRAKPQPTLAMRQHHTTSSGTNTEARRVVRIGWLAVWAW